ncbi:MAG: DUF1501 domain-containing protein [Blastochloris sp.]|nr:DUF1501 domain-containing protein [Blastochloris sp.]
MKTRRQFLHSSFMGAATLWTLPSFLNHTIMQMDLHAADSLTQVSTGKDGRILVVLQMGGGNDGLNTVVPYSNDAYYAARSSLGIKADSVLKLNEHLGLHPKLTGLKNLHDSGHLALLNGVGYPNPNRSHFRSMEIWHTASDSDKNEHYGWLGRYFDNTCQGQPKADPAIGIDISSMPRQAFLGPQPLGIALANADRYRFLESVENSASPLMASADSSEIAGTNSGSSIENLGYSSSESNGMSNLDFLQRTALDAELSSQEIRGISSNYKSKVSYPRNRLGSDLQLIAKLIGGGLPTRVYYANQGGYDTHANQLGSHERLMDELSSALSAFVADLKEQGNFDRVLIMTFSEFGRRVKENASRGTDHGVAGPMFLLGGQIKPGIHSDYPSLTDLDKGDLKHRVDFRSVYATVLENWLQTKSDPILKKSFPKINFI